MFSKISQRPAFERSDFLLSDVKEELKKRCPNPDPSIVNKLVSDNYGGNNFALRLPWATTPQRSFYDLEEVKDFARILDLLRRMGVYPPAQTKSQGGKGGLPNIVGAFEGPTQITPAGNASGRYLAQVPEIEMEEKNNALSSRPGGLADACAGVVSAVFGSSGQRQVRSMFDAYELYDITRESLLDEAERNDRMNRDFDRKMSEDQAREAPPQRIVEEEKEIILSTSDFERSDPKTRRLIREHLSAMGHLQRDKGGQTVPKNMSCLCFRKILSCGAMPCSILTPTAILHLSLHHWLLALRCTVLQTTQGLHGRLRKLKFCAVTSTARV